MNALTQGHFLFGLAINLIPDLNSNLQIVRAISENFSNCRLQEASFGKNGIETTLSLGKFEKIFELYYQHQQRRHCNGCSGNLLCCRLASRPDYQTLQRKCPLYIMVPQKATEFTQHHILPCQSGIFMICLNPHNNVCMFNGCFCGIHETSWTPQNYVGHCLESTKLKQALVESTK